MLFELRRNGISKEKLPLLYELFKFEINQKRHLEYGWRDRISAAERLHLCQNCILANWIGAANNELPPIYGPIRPR